MIKISLWCVYIFPIIGYLYGFYMGKNNIFIFCLGMMITMIILTVLSLFVENNNDKR